MKTASELLPLKDAYTEKLSKAAEDLADDLIKQHSESIEKYFEIDERFVGDFSEAYFADEADRRGLNRASGDRFARVTLAALEQKLNRLEFSFECEKKESPSSPLFASQIFFRVTVW